MRFKSYGQELLDFSDVSTKVLRKVRIINLTLRYPRRISLNKIVRLSSGTLEA